MFEFVFGPLPAHRTLPAALPAGVGSRRSVATIGLRLYCAFCQIAGCGYALPPRHGFSRCCRTIASPPRALHGRVLRRGCIVYFSTWAALTGRLRCLPH